MLVSVRPYRTARSHGQNPCSKRSWTSTTATSRAVAGSQRQSAAKHSSPLPVAVKPPMILTYVQLQGTTAVVKPLEHEARELGRRAVRELNRTVTVQGAERK